MPLLTSADSSTESSEWQVFCTFRHTEDKKPLLFKKKSGKLSVMSDNPLTAKDKAFYTAWTALLLAMKEYADQNDLAFFSKEADFPDYIYRMERPYDLPTTIMSASLSDNEGKPVLMLSVSPRHAVFKELVLHPFESHVYRKLKYSAEKEALVEGKRIFTKDMLYTLADDLFGVHA